MTEREFDERTETWYDLLDLANEYGYYNLIENIYDRDGFNNYINDCLVDWARNEDWRDLRDRLENLPDAYNGDCLRLDEYGEWCILDDDDLADCRDDLRESMRWNDEFEIEDDESDEYIDSEYLAGISPDDSFEQGCDLQDMFDEKVTKIVRVETSEEDDKRTLELLGLLSA